MNIKPLGDRILAKIKGSESKTAGGIIIPPTAQEKTQNAIVEAIGDDSSITVKVGDEIIYDKYAGTTIKIDNDELLLISIKDILAIVK